MTGLKTQINNNSNITLLIVALTGCVFQPSVRLTPAAIMYAGRSPDKSHILVSAVSVCVIVNIQRGLFGWVLFVPASESTFNDSCSAECFVCVLHCQHSKGSWVFWWVLCVCASVSTFMFLWVLLVLQKFSVNSHKDHVLVSALCVCFNVHIHVLVSVLCASVSAFNRVVFWWVLCVCASVSTFRRVMFWWVLCVYVLQCPQSCSSECSVCFMSSSLSTFTRVISGECSVCVCVCVLQSTFTRVMFCLLVSALCVCVLQLNVTMVMFWWVLCVFFMCTFIQAMFWWVLCVCVLQVHLCPGECCVNVL